MSDLYIGLISGTSFDAIDAALIRLEGSHIDLVSAHSHPYPNALRDQLMDFARSSDQRLDEYATLDCQLGAVFAEAALELLAKAKLKATQIRAIGSHGQTLLHAADRDPAFSLQASDPNIIAARTQITTVADFRRRDLALGGQGAPLAPAFHAACMRSSSTNRAVLNLGGIANLTQLPADDTGPVIGFDTGPANCLMDRWSEIHLHKPLDSNGQWAASGKVINALLERLLEAPYFDLDPPKSTGPELFNLDWLDQNIKTLTGKPLPEDVQATLLELTALSITKSINALTPQIQQVLACGGGVHNAELMGRLKASLHPITVETTEMAGVPPDWVEAMCFGWLAARTLDGQSGNIATVTGASHNTVLGGIYPANKKPGHQ